MLPLAQSGASQQTCAHKMMLNMRLPPSSLSVQLLGNACTCRRAPDQTLHLLYVNWQDSCPTTDSGTLQQPSTYSSTCKARTPAASSMGTPTTLHLSFAPSVMQTGQCVKHESLSQASLLNVLEAQYPGALNNNHLLHYQPAKQNTLPVPTVHDTSFGSDHSSMNWAFPRQPPPSYTVTIKGQWHARMTHMPISKWNT